MLAQDNVENLQTKYVITRMYAMEVAKEAKDQKAEARKLYYKAIATKAKQLNVAMYVKAKLQTDKAQVFRCICFVGFRCFLVKSGAFSYMLELQFYYN